MILSEIEEYLSKKDLNAPVRIDKCSVVENPKKMIKSHLSFLKHNSGNKAYMPYYNRLLNLCKKLKDEDQEKEGS